MCQGGTSPRKIAIGKLPNYHYTLAAIHAAKRAGMGGGICTAIRARRIWPGIAEALMAAPARPSRSLTRTGDSPYLIPMFSWRLVSVGLVVILRFLLPDTLGHGLYY